MRRRYEQLRQSEAGFTLIELLIVIVILGVLAAIVVFSVRGINNQSAGSACQADVATVNSALEAYYAQHHSYPGALDALWTGDQPLLKSAPTFGRDSAFDPNYQSDAGTIDGQCNTI